ncbi:MAG TPA: hypothetical protein VGR28_08990 [Candidatus Thermoplasmatota archaeon]|jgi:hypothetical protein|nr:hypothetical protein [Candidatus Thermoplasmatota archaeon]
MRLPSVLLAALVLVPSAMALGPSLEGPDAGGAVARAQAALDAGAWLGKNPRGWIAWGQAQFAAAPGALATAPLPDAVEHLYATLGLVPTGAQRADLAARAALLDPALARAFGGLVAAFDRVYRAQGDVVAALDWDALGRDPMEARPLLPQVAAAAGAANADALLGAVRAFRAMVEPLPPQARAVPFADPLGVVKLGSTADETFVADGAFRDPALLVDLGGNDLDLTSAGGACPDATNANGIMLCNGLAAALRVDLGGDDTYLFTRPHEVAQGAGGVGGLGVLVDAVGSDTYTVTQATLFSPTIAGVSLNYHTSVAQGSGEAGIGVLLDLAGDDHYAFTMTSDAPTNWEQGQGFAGLGGLGALLDATGDDHYAGVVDCPNARRYWCGVYIQGTAIYPGVALLLDAAGNDAYNGLVVAPQEDYYSQGFAAFGGLGLQVDLLGDDAYFESARSHGPGTFGVSLNCAYGSAFYGGAFAAFLDVAGDDSYVSETIDFVQHPSTMSEGFSFAAVSLFWDVSGADHHEMRSLGNNPVIAGRGTGMELLDTFAVYLDTGGTDTYADTPASQTIGANDDVWPSAAGLGVDVDVVPSLGL